MQTAREIRTLLDNFRTTLVAAAGEMNREFKERGIRRIDAAGADVHSGPFVADNIAPRARITAAEYDPEARFEQEAVTFTVETERMGTQPPITYKSTYWGLPTAGRICAVCWVDTVLRGIDAGYLAVAGGTVIKVDEPAE